MKIDIPPEALEKIIQSVWCTSCSKASVMENYSYRPVENGIILDGQCSMCGGFVFRVIEGE